VKEAAGSVMKKSITSGTSPSMQIAFHSILRKGKEEDENCVSCHVTGYNQPGGYSLKTKAGKIF